MNLSFYHAKTHWESRINDANSESESRNGGARGRLMKRSWNEIREHGKSWEWEDFNSRNNGHLLVFASNLLDDDKILPHFRVLKLPNWLFSPAGCILNILLSEAYIFRSLNHTNFPFEYQKLGLQIAHFE